MCYYVIVLFFKVIFYNVISLVLFRRMLFCDCIIVLGYFIQCYFPVCYLDAIPRVMTFHKWSERAAKLYEVKSIFFSCDIRYSSPDFS